MKAFLIRLACFLSIGFAAALLLLLSYLHQDPFRVVKKYDHFTNLPVMPSRDYVSTEMFRRNYKRQQYNSFLIGSSRTMAFRMQTWKSYLPADARPFVFTASAQTVEGIYNKLRYLDSLGVEIKHALVLIDHDFTFSDMQNPRGYIYMKHPATSNTSWLAFHRVSFRAYRNPHFLYSYYWYAISKKYRPFMDNYIERHSISFDSITNQLDLAGIEAEVQQNPEAYYAGRANLFYKRPGEQTDPVQKITSRHQGMLQEIKQILEKSQADYKVIITPLYEQQKFNPADLRTLQQVFGARLYDFSGRNQLTENQTNFYETNHFRPAVGDSILRVIYQ